MFTSSNNERFLVVAVYRPGSDQLNDTFHHEFCDLLDAVCVFSCPVFILGDINIHLDNLDNHHTVKFSHALASVKGCLVQHLSKDIRLMLLLRRQMHSCQICW